MDFRSSKKAVERLVSYLEPGDGKDFDEFGRLLRDFESRFQDDPHGQLFLFLSPPEALQIDIGTPHFGPDVAAKFPSLAYEIGQASKALALGLSTASAFHSIRSL